MSYNKTESEKGRYPALTLVSRTHVYTYVRMHTHRVERKNNISRRRNRVCDHVEFFLNRKEFTMSDFLKIEIALPNLVDLRNFLSLLGLLTYCLHNLVYISKA